MLKAHQLPAWASYFIDSDEKSVDPLVRPLQQTGEFAFLKTINLKKKKIKSAWNRPLKNLSWIKLMAESGFLMLTWSRWDVNVPANDHLGWSGLKLCGRNWWWQTSPELYERRVMLWHDVSASNCAFSCLCSVNSRKPHCFRVKLFSWLAD